MIEQIFDLQNPWRKDNTMPFHLNTRKIFKVLKDNLENELILGLTGSRQVGKSSLIYLIIENLLKNNVRVNNIFYFNLDDLKLQSLFSNIPEFFQFIGDDPEKKYIFIDEIQRLNSPGLFLKELFDLKRNIKIIFSGSSQLEIRAKTKEHLAGRVRNFNINRLTFEEYLDFARPSTREETLKNILLYGSYPAVAKAIQPIEKKLRIKDIFQSYVQKDLVDFIKIKDVETYNKFLIRAAAQTGDLLNIQSISNSLGISRGITEEYINILEHTFICKRIYPFHRKHIKEITKTPKLYFLDLGLRNFILNNFNELEIRTDKGSLFENFYLTELLSNDFYSLDRINFWRTANKTEVDFIVQHDGTTEAIEVKWSNQTRPKAFYSLESLYPGIKTKVITTKEFLQVL
ncbi:MAG: ATP-binding protein [Bacteroidetes bacterium]|nr:ATP-binding protein [Bacteroidota bacterium]